MLQPYDEATGEFTSFTNGIVTTICSSRGIGVHYCNNSPDGDVFDFAYWDSKLLHYPRYAEKQLVQVRQTRTSTTWRDTQVLQLLGERKLNEWDIEREKLASSDEGCLVPAFIVAGEKPNDDGGESKNYMCLAFNIRMLYWKFQTTPRLEHCNLFSTVTLYNPTKRKALPTKAMVLKKPRHPQSNKPLQYMNKAVHLMQEISKLFHADATEVHEFIASQTLQAARAARLRHFEKSRKMCIFRELGSKCDCYSIYVPANYRGEQPTTFAIYIRGPNKANPFFMNIIQAALDTCCNSLPSIAEKKEWVARGRAAIEEDLKAHWKTFGGLGTVTLRARVTNLSHPR